MSRYVRLPVKVDGTGTHQERELEDRVPLHTKINELSVS